MNLYIPWLKSPANVLRNIYTYKLRNFTNKLQNSCSRVTAHIFSIPTRVRWCPYEIIEFYGSVHNVKLIQILLSFSINMPEMFEIAKGRVKSGWHAFADPCLG